MDITTIKDEEYRKEYKVSIPSASIIQSADGEIIERSQTFKLAGFREGKVPVSIVKRQIGSEVLARHIDRRINETIKVLVDERKLTLASGAGVEVQEFNPEGNLIFTVGLNILPNIPAINWDDEIFKKVEILDLTVSQEDMNNAYDSIIKMSKNFVKAEQDYQSKLGDAIIIDFVGKINGEEFEGNKASSIKINIGDKQFITDFENQLIDLKEGDNKVIKVSFPQDYHNNDIAGKEAEFEIKVHEVLKEEGSSGITLEFVQKLGVESIEKFDELLKNRIKLDFDNVARLRVKKQLFDLISEKCSFQVPTNMVDADYEVMWKEVEKSLEDKPQNRPIEEIKEEIKSIALRRVKLGLILADLARSNNIQVEQEDLNNSIRKELERRPGQDKEILEFYNKPENVEKAKGSILEEKVVDFILLQIPTSKVTVTAKEFNDKYAAEMK